ncbi:hypothetical protein TRVA0_013S01002 [Trichomonascus vanleenenianus]|uniref:uncharacterized protein n=1 Tax=Trichomonascus vanleenenianus TaxID=2268995 RepID=UPI003ECA12F3
MYPKARSTYGKKSRGGPDSLRRIWNLEASWKADPALRSSVRSTSELSSTDGKDENSDTEPSKQASKTPEQEEKLPQLPSLVDEPVPATPRKSTVRERGLNNQTPTPKANLRPSREQLTIERPALNSSPTRNVSESENSDTQADAMFSSPKREFSKSSVWDELDDVIADAHRNVKRIKLLDKFRQVQNKPLVEDSPLKSAHQDQSENGSKPIALSRSTTSSFSSREAMNSRLQTMSLTKKTYGGGVASRAISSDNEREYDDLDEPLTPEEPEIRDTQDDILNVKNVHELRAQGVNAEFVSDVKYIMEGLNFDEGSKQGTLVELAEKFCSDKEFADNFKMSPFAMELYEKVTAEDDDFCAFMLIWLSNCMFEDGEGFALTIVTRFEWFLPLLIKMMSDKNSIKEVAKANNVSHGDLDALMEVVKATTKADPTVHVSRAWIALNTLNSLANLGANIQILTQRVLNEHAIEFLRCTREVSDAVYGELVSGKKRRNQQLPKDLVTLGLTTMQLTSIAEHTDVPDLIAAIETLEDNPLECLAKVAIYYLESDRDGLAKTTVDAILRCFVVLTTRFGSAGVFHYSAFYGPLALSLVRMGLRPSHSKTATSDDDDTRAYSAGLLYNLTDSKHICELILKEEVVIGFKQLALSFEPYNPDLHSNVQTVHIYGILVLARLMAISSEDAHRKFTDDEIFRLRKTLSASIDNLASSPMMRIVLPHAKELLENLT